MIEKYVNMPITQTGPTVVLSIAGVGIILYLLYLTQMRPTLRNASSDACFQFSVVMLFTLQAVGAFVILVIVCQNFGNFNKKNIKVIGANINSKNGKITSYGSDAIEWAMNTCTASNLPIIVNTEVMRENKTLFVLRILFASIN